MSGPGPAQNAARQTAGRWQGLRRRKCCSSTRRVGVGVLRAKRAWITACGAHTRKLGTMGPHTSEICALALAMIKLRSLDLTRVHSRQHLRPTCCTCTRVHAHHGVSDTYANGEHVPASPCGPRCFLMVCGTPIASLSTAAASGVQAPPVCERAAAWFCS
jgi:hypothetical protein